MSVTNNSPLSVGIDFGGTSVKIGVCQGAEVIELAEPIVTANYEGSDALISAMAATVAELKEKHPSIAAVGSGVPGLVDFDDGFIHELTNVPGWSNVPFRDLLAQKTGLPAIVDNDANCMAYAEWRYGAGQGMKNIIALTLGTGVGGGLVLNGELYRGTQFGAGEVGQMSMDYKGKAGHYGNLGALEVYMGNQQLTEHAILRYAAAGIAKSEADCTPKKIADAAKSGDNIARQIWGEAAEWLGTVLASIVWLLNPDGIIIGGGVSKAGDLLFEPLGNKMKGMLSPVLWEKLQLIPARFGNDAGIIGSAAQALDAALKK
jgi:glucokinase